MDAGGSVSKVNTVYLRVRTLLGLNYENGGYVLLFLVLCLAMSILFLL